jgi:hypothetical protein
MIETRVCEHKRIRSSLTGRGSRWVCSACGRFVPGLRFKTAESEPEPVMLEPPAQGSPMLPFMWAAAIAALIAIGALVWVLNTNGL